MRLQGYASKMPNLGVVSGFSDSQLLLLSVLHNTATEQNTETLVFAVRLSQTETATAVFLRYYRNRTTLKKCYIRGDTEVANPGVVKAIWKV